MNAQRYWVVGGEYADTSFKTLTCSRPTVVGPFESEDDARQAWKGLYSGGSTALTRFSIVHENVRLGG
jgi:hypothetical protein